MSAIRKNPEDPAATGSTSPRRRLSPQAREHMIVEGAIRFFSEHGLDGQLRDLASRLGITHTLLYHYFPTKQALIERVYAELFEGRWRVEWEVLLDDKALDAQTKLSLFYIDYAKVILERDWVRIFIFSGLSDRYITERYFAMLEARLFPRLIRESRKFRGQPSRSKPTARELELLMGLHGGIFYTGMRRWVYGHAPLDGDVAAIGEGHIRDRVSSYLLSLDQILQPASTSVANTFIGINPLIPQEEKSLARRSRIARSKSAPQEETHSWPTH
jgi:AcrR family transcriptional regulator